MKNKLAVVIPYYQRKSGVLRRTLSSVFGQTGVPEPLIIIVDDESPIPSRTELASLPPGYSEKILVVEQKNGGAAAARNAGLDHVPPEIHFVAFLDSDDSWSESHLRRALWSLENGVDFYFSDFHQLNQTVTAFDRAKRIDVSQHPRIHTDEPIHEYRGDMFHQIITGNILGTSTTAYNYRKFPELRYPLGYRHTGEEYLFWLYLARLSGKIAFSSESECHYGAGVNIFADSGWGSDKYLTIQQDEVKWRKFVMKSFPVSSEQNSFLTTCIRTSRENFALGLIHNLIHNRRVSWPIIRDQMKVDPLTFPAGFISLARLWCRKITKKFYHKQSTPH